MKLSELVEKWKIRDESSCKCADELESLIPTLQAERDAEVGAVVGLAAERIYTCATDTELFNSILALRTPAQVSALEAVKEQARLEADAALREFFVYSQATASHAMCHAETYTLEEAMKALYRIHEAADKCDILRAAAQPATQTMSTAGAAFAHANPELPCTCKYRRVAQFGNTEWQRDPACPRHQPAVTKRDDICPDCKHSLINNDHGFDQNDGYMVDDELVHYGRCTYCRVCNPEIFKNTKQKE